MILQKIGADHNKRQRLKDIAKFIIKEKFDVIMLQELYAIEDINLLRKLLSTHGYNIYHGEIESTLGGFWNLNLSGLVMVSLEKLVFIKQLPFEQQTMFDAFIRIHRCMLWCFTATSHILLCNVHFTPSNSVCNILMENHDIIITQQLKQLYEELKLRHMQKEYQPTGWIIGGDFNVDHRSRVFQKNNPLLKLKTFYTTLATPSCNNQVEFAHQWTESNSCLDHIFSSFPIVEQSKPVINLSDHYPIITTLAL